MWILLAALGAPALASTVAVLPFDGYDVTYDDTEAVAAGLRDAFLVEGQLNPLSQSEITDALTSSARADLARARDRIAEARSYYQDRRAELALPMVDEGIDLHYAAWSDVGRRPELADAWYLKALCLFALERDDEAADAFKEASFLYPKYLRDRATSLPSAAIGLAAGAQADIETGRRRIRTTDTVSQVGSALHVEFVVIGWVEGDGDVVARLYEEGRFVAEEVRRLDSGLPAGPVDAAYDELAVVLTRAAVGGAAPTRRAPTPAPEPKPSRYSDLEDDRPVQSSRDREREEREAREREEEERAARDREDRDRAAREREEREQAAREREERDAAAREREEREQAAREREEREQAAREREQAARDKEDERQAAARERQARRDDRQDRCVGDDAPVTCRWWFWAATAGGAGGVSALLGYVLYEPPPVEVTGPPTWSVEIAN